jgi:hypothetical protein
MKSIFEDGLSRRRSSMPTCISFRQARPCSGSACYDATSRDDALERVASYARRNPTVQVIVGHGWDERGWPEPVPPTRNELTGQPMESRSTWRGWMSTPPVVSSTLLDQLPGVTAASRLPPGWAAHPAGPPPVSRQPGPAVYRSRAPVCGAHRTAYGCSTGHCGSTRAGRPASGADRGPDPRSGGGS